MIVNRQVRKSLLVRMELKTKYSLPLHNNHTLTVMSKIMQHLPVCPLFLKEQEIRVSPFCTSVMFDLVTRHSPWKKISNDTKRRYMDLAGGIAFTPAANGSWLGKGHRARIT
jgi:hypothetical protein